MTPGRPIVLLSWASVAITTVSVLLEAVGLDAAHGATVAISLALFFVSLPVWAAAFVLAVVRSTRGEDVTVMGMFFLAGSAPRDVQRHLMGAFGASIVLAGATMWVDPYVVLVPMLPLGLAGLWAARFGTFPPRRLPARGGAKR